MKRIVLFIVFSTIFLYSYAARIAKVDTVGIRSVDVTFHNTDTIHYGATLTLPDGQRRSPAIVIISGSYPQDRDGMMAGHPVYKQIAEYLSHRGYAVLRVDDRGVGETNGVYDKCTTEDFAKDAIAAVEYLKTRPDIKHKTIGILGHSEGGASGSIAASRCKDIKFFISAAGLMTDGLNSVIQQNYDIVHTTPQLTDYDKARYDSINKIMFHLCYKYADADSATLSSALWKAYDEWTAVDTARFAHDFPGKFDHFRFPIYSFALTATSPWYRFFIRYNPERYLSKVNIPVLAINGTKDVMVNYKQNLGNVKRYLAHDKDVTTVAIEGVNHLLLPCDTGTQQEYRSIKSPVSDKALSVIYEWLRKRFR